ncbi:MipA/OmpV family protein [Serratia quinivorans]|uniref:MipA/OmpV family protein n=1 Tax=Serratia quinivorans TaxID=137545 RepID=UPI0021BB5122|nr:MipA/OmpV family protein [Serratia quinivorans]
MMIKKQKLTWILLSAGCLSHPAWAQSPWTLGASVLISPSPYQGEQDRVMPLPVIGYDSDRFFVQGLSAGAYLWKDQQNQLSLNAYYSPLHFKASDSDNDAMKQLNNRHATMMGGIGYRHQASWGTLRTELATDMLNNSNGFTGDVAYLYPIERDDWQFRPGVGVTYSNGKTNDYYYGVSSDESARSGLSAYKAGSSWSPYLELSASYQLTPQWTTFITGRYTHLANSITDSPMVDKSGSGMLWTGVTYRF